METPIFDFLKKYSDSDISRFHMPGHKGKSFLGFEKFDITEISGADSLFDAHGIIAKSEKNASSIFETGATFYSAEGSSLSIKAMIYTAMLTRGNKPKKIAAVRNVHKSFINACALLDIDVKWIYPADYSTLCDGVVSNEEIEQFLAINNDVFALYITSPNYLGQISDITSISKVCRKYNIPLLVDNAHGAYLKFCNMHPIDLGADMCCDSAHKTLPVLTGGAYLHVKKNKEQKYAPLIKNAMSVFASTSPSYIIMASLDLCNKIISDDYEKKIKATILEVEKLKNYIKNSGFNVADGEPLKLTVFTHGDKMADFLRKRKMECEYSDKTALVLMFTPENTKYDFNKIKETFLEAEPTNPILPPKIIPSKKQLTLREAFISPYKTVNIHKAAGHICATPCVSCPPAIPIAISGEIINENTVKLFEFYNIENVNIIK